MAAKVPFSLKLLAKNGCESAQMLRNLTIDRVPMTESVCECVELLGLLRAVERWHRCQNTVCEWVRGHGIHAVTPRCRQRL